MIDENGYIVSIFDIIEVSKYSVSGVCYRVFNWVGENKIPVENHFVASVYCKFDSCTHWYFKGEDYDPNPEVHSDQDSYYHICGSHLFIQHIREMCFVWKIVCDLMTELRDDTYTIKWYYEAPCCKELIEMMLKDYRIEKVSE